MRKLESIQKEIGDVRGREEDVRRGLRECGGRYEAFVGNGKGMVVGEGKERGLENLGGGVEGGWSRWWCWGGRRGRKAGEGRGEGD